jgi:hypothetical protein
LVFEYKLGELMEKSIVFENAPEQHIYAKIIYHISNLGLLALIMGFILYIFGVLTPLVPLEELPQYWSLSLTQFLEKNRSAYRLAMDINVRLW